MGKLYRWTECVLAGIGAFILFCMMTYTFIDVWGRYLFNSPLPGGLEVTELMMATLIFAGLPLVTAANQHVTIDILDPLLSPLVKKVLDILAGAICVLVSGLLCWRVAIRASEAKYYQDVTMVIKIPLSPFIFFMAIMLGLMTLLFFLKMLNRKFETSI